METLVIPGTEAADNDTVNAIVGNANAVWIAGGDQSTYIKFWKGRKLEQTLKNAMGRQPHTWHCKTHTTPTLHLTPIH